jgi:hypothetical protein
VAISLELRAGEVLRAWRWRPMPGRLRTKKASTRRCVLLGFPAAGGCAQGNGIRALGKPNNKRANSK